MLKLNQSEIRKLQVLWKTHKDKRVYIKVTAILLYRTEEVGNILGIDGDTVNRYRKKFSEVPLNDYLRDNYVGKGKAPKLSSHQLRLLSEELHSYLYLTLGEIRDYVLHTYDAEYSKEGMRDLVRRQGFRYKKTRPVPGKADSEKQQQWVNRFEEDMSQLSEKEEIYFIDGVHPMHNTRPESGWIKKGRGLRATGKLGPSALESQWCRLHTTPRTHLPRGGGDP